MVFLVATTPLFSAPSWRFRLCAVPPFGAFNGFNPGAPLTKSIVFEINELTH